MRTLAGRAAFACIGYVAIMTCAAVLAKRLGVDIRFVFVPLFAALLLVALALVPSARSFMSHLLGRRPTLPLAVGAALAGAAFLVVYMAIWTDPGRIHGWERPGSWAVIALSFLVMPLIEEFLFRGVVIGQSRGAEAMLAALLAAGCFALLHHERWASVFVFSLIAAAFYVRGGLGAAWAFHAAYNLSNYGALLWFSVRNA